MKQPGNSNTNRLPDDTVSIPAPAQALDPSEITVVLNDGHEPEFDPLPHDLAPTRFVPESEQPSHPPELRPTHEEISTQVVPVRDLFSSRPQDSLPASRRTEQHHTASSATGGAKGLWVVLGICVVLGGGTAAWFLWPKLRPAADSSVPSKQASSQPETVPPELRTYMEQAKGGDAKAMHMMAVMYWNGLNVRQDRVKGLEWYRKAAAAGSTAAQQFLKDNGLQ
jgi:hypothetical protein